MRDETKATIFARTKFLYSSGLVDAITASPALCVEEWSCQTPPGGLTAAWKAMVAMRTTTTIMTSLIFLRNSTFGTMKWLSLLSGFF